MNPGTSCGSKRRRLLDRYGEGERRRRGRRGRGRAVTVLGMKVKGMSAQALVTLNTHSGLDARLGDAAKYSISDIKLIGEPSLKEFPLAITKRYLDNLADPVIRVVRNKSIDFRYLYRNGNVGQRVGALKLECRCH